MNNYYRGLLLILYIGILFLLISIGLGCSFYKVEKQHQQIIELLKNKE